MSSKIKKLFRRFSPLFLGFAWLLLGGCNPKVTVSPLERAYLADYLMRADRDKLSVKMFDHAYFSREASRGGRGVGGGGCGLQLIKRRLRLSWVAALLLLQRAPAVPWVKQAFSLLSPFVQKALAWRVALPAVSGAATWHALSGATTYVKSDETNPATGTEGDSFSFGFYTSGYKAFSYKLEGLPSGLSYNGSG